VQAFVDFESYEEASKAMREKDHKVFNEKFGDRYVRLIQVSPPSWLRCSCVSGQAAWMLDCFNSAGTRLLGD
jgi:hypothetical protein